MPADALALVLTAAVLHALWNFAAKQVTIPGTTFVWLYTVGSALIWLPVAVVWVVVSGDRPSWVWLLGGFGTAVLHTAYALVLQGGYARGALNVVYPVARGVGPLVTAVVAVVFLGESLGLAAAVGVGAVLVGVFVVAAGGAGARAGLAWGVATGLTIAAYTLWDDHAVTDLAIPAVPYFALGEALQVPWLTVMLGREGRRTLPSAWRAERGRVLVVALLSPLAYVLVLEAMRLAPVALVAPVRETSIVIGALLSWLVLREARPVRGLLGAGIVLAGIAAIALG
ncbi:hypothetical protein GCM10011519_29070 [Marmoricola endophyticus]|uniref:EamA domain-containing protein n=1 Tax=Marmoricola endophyticus TaxID=2040280 RepID=A0A917F669_9ACTN|nr:DMT family transporter [Marmoricola endophyticus]GGF53340.1 hypothetical protein GCM10011519_29070 [Marmoricola endophyticus]